MMIKKIKQIKKELKSLLHEFNRQEVFLLKLHLDERTKHKKERHIERTDNR